MADSDNDIKPTIPDDSDDSDYSTDMDSSSTDSAMTGSDMKDVTSDAEWFKDTDTASEAGSDYDEHTKYALNQNNEELIQKGAEWYPGESEEIRGKISSLKWSEELESFEDDGFSLIKPPTVREVITNALSSAEFLDQMKNKQSILTKHIGIDRNGRLFYEKKQVAWRNKKDNFREEFIDVASAIQNRRCLFIHRVKKAIKQFQFGMERIFMRFLCGMSKLKEVCKGFIIGRKNSVGDVRGVKRVMRKCRRPIRSMQKIISITNAVSQDYAEGGRTSAERLKAVIKMKQIFWSRDVSLEELIRRGNAKKIISRLHLGIEHVQRALGHTMTLEYELILACKE